MAENRTTKSVSYVCHFSSVPRWEYAIPIDLLSLLVSRAKITLNSDTLVRQFSAPEAVKKAIDSYGVDSEKLLEPGSPEQPSPAPIPSLAKISAVITPPECATFLIRDTDTGREIGTEASLPIGSRISLDITANESYNIVTSPEVQDSGDYVVTGDVTFTITGTPKV